MGAAAGSRAKNRLSVAGVKAAPTGSHQDGGGLILVKTSREAGFWTWRYQAGGRRRDMGLGRWPDVGLAEARHAREEWAKVLRAGRDPIAERDRRREEERAAAARDDPTLDAAVDRTLEALAPTLRDGGGRGRWRSPLGKHVLPKLGTRRVSSLTERDVEDVLRPIWVAQPPTAAKVRRRLRMVLEREHLLGSPCDPVIVDRAVVRLGEVRHVEVPIPATAWQDIPALYARLDRPTRSHNGLRLLMLTVVRSEAVLGMRAAEVRGDVWTVPAARIKGRVGKVSDFQVPLPSPALAIVQELAELADGGMLLAGPDGGKLTHQALEGALDDLGEAGRPHGFRTAFRTWAEETRAVPWDVAETALQHVYKKGVERSYARSDLLDQRREAMRLWGAFVTGNDVAKTAT